MQGTTTSAPVASKDTQPNYEGKHSSRVMIVDDNATNLKLASLLIAPYGVQIGFAKNGIEAIQRVQERAYDVVFMDHIMPEMDGVQAAAAIHALDGDRYRDLPIIAMTAGTEVENREWFLQRGFQDFIAKPMGKKELAEVMNHWVARETPDIGSEVSEKPGEVLDGQLPIKGLNVERGLFLIGGNWKEYREILSLYCASVDAYRISFSKAISSEDLCDFSIRIHALKSSSAYIGAAQLSNEASVLDKAGREGDLETIQKNKAHFDAELFELVSSIREMLLSDWEK